MGVTDKLTEGREILFLVNQYSKSWVFKLSSVFFTATLHLHLIGVTWAFCYFTHLNFREKNY